MLYKKYSLLLPKLLIYGNERSSTVFHFCSKTRMYQTVLQFFIFFLIFYKSYYIFLKSLVKQLSNEVLHLTFTYIQAELWTMQQKLWYNCSKSAWCYVRGVSTKAPKSESAKSNNRNRNRRFRLFDYEVYLSINNRQKNICSQRNKRVPGTCSPFFLYTTRLHQFTNTASRQL